MVRVGVLTATDQLPHYVLAERGFAADHGLRIDERPMVSGAEIVAALAADEIDIGGVVGVPPLVAAAQAGVVPDKVVGVMAGGFVSPEHPLFAVVLGHGVRSWDDLAEQMQRLIDLVDPTSRPVPAPMQLYDETLLDEVLSSR